MQNEEEIYVRPLAKGMGEAVARRTYFRKEDNENMLNVANRVALGNSLLCEPEEDSVSEYNKLRKYIAKGLMPTAGRHLQHGDENQPDRQIELFSNCSTAPTTFLLFYFLLNGSGVGRCYDTDLMIVDWKKSPKIIPVLSELHPDYKSRFLSLEQARFDYPDAEVFVVDDSREGWAKAVEYIENIAYSGELQNRILLIDCTQIRPEGTPIKGMQNKPAPGPIYLMDSFVEMGQIIKLAHLTNMSNNEMTLRIDHALAKCVVAGGSRRSARLSAVYWKDKFALKFIDIKKEGDLWSANNSILLDDGFWKSLRRGTKIAQKIARKMSMAAYYDDSGEPGAINAHLLNNNLENIEEMLNYANNGELIESNGIYSVEKYSQQLIKDLANIAYKKKNQFIVNPCVTGDTLVTTTEGDVRVDELINKPFKAVVDFNDYNCKTGFFLTGTKDVYLMETESGYKLKCTENHEILSFIGEEFNCEFHELKDLSVGDHVVLNNMTADNCEPEKIISIKYIGKEDVYDCTVDEIHAFSANGIIVHNCGEIPLHIMGGICVIGDVAPYHADSEDEIEDAVRAMVRFLMRVNKMPGLFQKEIHRTQRIGVSLTGVWEWIWSKYQLNFYDVIYTEKGEEVAAALRRFRDAAIDEAKKYAEFLGVNVPHTVLTQKPAGSNSKLWALSEGGHLPALKWYLRNVQFQSNDPLLQEYKEKGYPVVEQLESYKGMGIVGFPTEPEICKIMPEEKIVTAAEPSLEQHYDWLAFLEENWLGDEYGAQISYTAKYNPENLSYEEYHEMFFNNQERVRCCSVMPQIDATVYEYQPEQPISKEYFDQIQQNIIEDAEKEEIDVEHLKCTGGACPIDIIN